MTTKSALICSVSALCLLAANTAFALDCTPPTGGAKVWVTWLDKQESVGGHAEACHVAVASNGLIHRIESTGTVTGTCNQANAASSFTNKATAAAAISALSAAIGTAAAGAAGDTIIDGTAGGNIGEVVSLHTGKKGSQGSCKNTKYDCTKTKKFKVLVRKTANACFLLTAYPS